MSTRQIFNWNPEKNLLLIRERGISFERVVVEISSGNVSIHAPYGANLEEVTPLPNEFYPPEGGGFKPGSVFDEVTSRAVPALGSARVASDPIYSGESAVCAVSASKALLAARANAAALRAGAGFITQQRRA